MRQAGEVLFCEHDAVYTFGVRQKENVSEAARLEKLGAQVFKVLLLPRSQTLLFSPFLRVQISVYAFR